MSLEASVTVTAQEEAEVEAEVEVGVGAVAEAEAEAKVGVGAEVEAQNGADVDVDVDVDADADITKIKELPREVGVMLITAGVVGLILPGPGTPAIIAGGLALWPNAFGKLESWLQRKYPDIHHKGMKQINRYLSDLERRYPDSTHR